MDKKAILKKAVKILLVLGLAGCLFLFLINLYMIRKEKPNIISADDAAALGDVDCIMVLGCSVRPDGTPSGMLRDRLDKGIELYEDGVSDRLLMSGDHGRKNYDEVNRMKQYAIDEGIPSGDIFMDHAGFSTYESMYRARDIFQVKKIIIVTQRYHMYRALYVAQAMGMEAYGVESDPRRYGGQKMRDLRELLAKDGITIRGVYERSDANERIKEGLPKVKGFIGEEFDTTVEILENGVHYLVDVANGQKTGFFLDQKYNRLAMHRICKGKKVLDCFTHMGTFALNAGIAGASDVTGLDISEYAVAQAEANARLNHLENTVHFRCANVLDELPKLAAAGEKYDVVILDPPAFTKSREATKNAIKGYREINMKGLKLVKDGGYLATCSCSHFMTQELLAKTVKEAAKATHKRLRQVEFRTQAPDHPILWAADESYYLKFYIFQVVDEK